MPVDQARAQAAVRELLIAVGEDPDREGLRDTPARVARSFVEMFAGLDQDPAELLTRTFAIDHDEMIIVRDIEVYSMCEHHLVPFHGVAHVGYIPCASGMVTGLSKIARLVDVFARRPQVQEKLTTQIADALVAAPQGRGRHRRHRVRAPVHVHARSPQAGLSDHHVRRARPAAQPRHPRRGNVVAPRRQTVTSAAACDLLGERTRTLVMGVVNVTPDSFSDGGAWFEPEAAVSHGQDLLAARADLIDVGGESTRPGAQRPPVGEEMRRVLPVVAALARAGAVVSIDTMRAEVAAEALECGATMVNDVSGGLADPGMLGLVAERAVPYVAMHWRGHSAHMQSRAVYDDVVAEVCRELAERRDAAVGAGVAPERIVLDPGLGFAKTAEHNWTLLAHLDALGHLGHPVLIGASRKAFLGRLGRPGQQPPAPPLERDDATVATSVLAALAGVWAVRVHDVVSTRWALDVVEAVRAHAGRRA